MVDLMMTIINLHVFVNRMDDKTPFFATCERTLVHGFLIWLFLKLLSYIMKIVPSLFMILLRLSFNPAHIFHTIVMIKV